MKALNNTIQIEAITDNKKLSHKVRMHLSVYAILIIATVLAIISGKVHSRELDLQLKTQTIYAFAPEKPYVMPTLNPNISEMEQNKMLIRKIWGQDSSTGLAIARCESGYRTAGPHVSNTDGSVDQGVFSINSVHEMPDMENAVANISYAYTKFLKQGTTPWDSSKSCWEGEVNE